MAGENIQLAQNTDAEVAAPVDPALDTSALDSTIPVDTGLDPNVAPSDGAPADSGLLDVAGANDIPVDNSLAANEAENPYGLAELWGQGDFVARGTLIILALMSLYSWVIMLT